MNTHKVVSNSQPIIHMINWVDSSAGAMPGSKKTGLSGDLMSLIEYNNWFKRNRVFKADSHDLQVESLVYAPTANSLFVQLRSSEGHEFDLRCVANITGAVTLYVAKKSDSFIPLNDLDGLRSWLIPQLSVPVPHSSAVKPKRKPRFKQKTDNNGSYSVNAW